MCNYTYIPNRNHHNNNPDKSQWTITEDEEISCFNLMYQSGWKDEDGKYGWGLKYTSPIATQFAILEKIGLTQQREITKIARFEHSDTFADGHVEWHGYPIDYQRRRSDIPVSKVLQLWVNARLITKSQMSKIQRMQKCNL